MNGERKVKRILVRRSIVDDLMGSGKRREDQLV